MVQNGENKKTINGTDWYYYAEINEKNIVVSKREFTEPIDIERFPHMIPVRNLDYFEMGYWYDLQASLLDPHDMIFRSEVPIHAKAAYSTDQINVGTEDKWVTTEITESRTLISSLQISLANLLSRMNTIETKMNQNHPQ